jgi:hypothetical protein
VGKYFTRKVRWLRFEVTAKRKVWKEKFCTSAFRKSYHFVGRNGMGLCFIDIGLTEYVRIILFLLIYFTTSSESRIERRMVRWLLRNEFEKL